jgi:tether containing UBX domain for GLUT4
LTARTQALVNAPLQLRATKEALDKTKRDRWPNTTIRVRFSDRTQLEKTFPSTDKIRSVYAFVRSSLRDDVKPVKFILYQSPPKRDLKVSDPKVRDLTLAELQLAPSSVLLLRFEDETLNRSDALAPLLSTVAAQATELSNPPTLESTVMAPKPEGAGSSSTSLGQKKIPKWFKSGLKK